MKIVLLTFIFFSILLTVNAYEKRDFLQKAFDINRLKNTLILNQEWVEYPDYNDRTGWDTLTGDVRLKIISKGEAALTYEWKVVKATDYLEFDRSGTRQSGSFDSNRSALSNLVLAELAEGQGRFLDQIANGVWLFCEMTSWVGSAHMHLHTRREKTSLPDYNEFVIDLSAGDMGSFLSWTYYFLKDELDNNVHPFISERLRENLQKRILDPYMNLDHPWHVFNATPFTKVNNWTPWVNFNAISAFLLMENDPDRLAAAIYRSMKSVDNFINYYHDDGACEEGTSYFSHAVGKMYDYLQILYYAGVPVSSVFKEPVIKRMGEFVTKAYIGDGWVVNYHDASPRYTGPIGLIYRYGEAAESNGMKQFASYLYYRNKDDSYIFAGSDIFRTIENMKSHRSVLSTTPLLSHDPYTWYPQTELLYMRNNAGFFFSAIAGTNQQSHNHNHVGSFVLYYKNNPVFIDVGVGTYSKQTFSADRYSIWTMQSDYHNLPVINGVPQRSLGTNRSPEEEKYRARDVLFNPKKSVFSADISGAYHPDSKVHRWVRSYIINSRGRLTIEDEFELTEVVTPNQVNFMTQAKPDISQVGKVKLIIKNEVIIMSYDSSEFEAEVEELPLTDNRLSSVWGETLYRLCLNAKKLTKKGKYIYVIEKGFVAISTHLKGIKAPLEDRFASPTENTDHLPSVFPSNYADLIECALRNEAVLKFAEHQFPANI